MLTEFGLGLSVLSKIKSLITIKFNAENNNDDEDYVFNCEYFLS